VVQWLGHWVCITVASRSNPILTSGQDSVSDSPDATLPPFVNIQLVASCQLGFSLRSLLSLNNNSCCFLHIIESKGPMN